jgi:protein-S-isoprenylcysteine O-methyltransferase Ste14
VEWLHQVRYWLAVLLYATLPPAVLYWYLIHPFAAFWRRLGIRWTFTVVGIVFLAVTLALASLHESVLAVSFRFSWPLAALGFVLYAVSIALEVSCRRHLKFRILAGVPEVSGKPGRLLTEGIYARVRNPRYLSLFFGVAAFALILNYLALYLAFVLFVPAVYGIILLEERELRERFGAEYEDYLRRVPRLIPRLR